MDDSRERGGPLDWTRTVEVEAGSLGLRSKVELSATKLRRCRFESVEHQFAHRMIGCCFYGLSRY